MFASAGRQSEDRPNGRARRQNRSRNDQSCREACVPGRRPVRPPTQRHSLVAQDRAARRAVGAARRTAWSSPSPWCATRPSSSILIYFFMAC